MDIIKILKTFLYSLLFPFKILIFFIAFAIYLRIAANCNKSTLPHIPYLCGKTLISILSVKIEIDDEDLLKYNKYIYSDKKTIAVFNHSSIIDAFVIMSTFYKFCSVMLRNPVFKFFGYNDFVHSRLGNIYVCKEQTTKNIIESVSNRKIGDPILFIAPGAGNTPTNPDNITEFSGNGAFVGKFPVIPIIMKYEDNSIHHNSDNGESFLHSSIKLFLLNRNYKIKIKVGDMIEPIETESVFEYKNRVYNIMNAEYQRIVINHKDI